MADFEGIARAFRCGQTKNVVVTRFYAKDTMEEELSQTVGVVARNNILENGQGSNIVDGNAVASSSRG